MHRNKMVAVLELSSVTVLLKMFFNSIHVSLLINSLWITHIWYNVCALVKDINKCHIREGIRLIMLENHADAWNMITAQRKSSFWEKMCLIVSGLWPVNINFAYSLCAVHELFLNLLSGQRIFLLSYILCRSQSFLYDIISCKFFRQSKNVLLHL